MLRTISTFTAALTIAAVIATAVCANAAEPLTEAERTAILAELKPLQERLDALRDAKKISSDHWADAAIFVKGVVWALDFGPVDDERSRGLVKFGLQRAKERIAALADRQHPWTDRRGRCARGFISAVDGSVQPYCLLVPEKYDPAKPMRLHVVLHGSTPAKGIGELLYLEASDSGAPADASTEYIEIHPMGRLGENAYRFEGETDVDEAIEAVCRDYNIDRSRIVLRGHSLGGVGTWALGLKRPDRYVAIGPGSAPADTIEFSNSPWEHFVRLDPLTPWQQQMLHLVDAIDYTANARMIPVVAVMGDKDPYYQSHVTMEKAFAKEGIPFNAIVDRGGGHSISLVAFNEHTRRLDEIAARGSDPFPMHVHFVTWTLKFSRCHWIEVLRLKKHYEQATIDAKIDADGAITVAEPQNITRFAIYPPAISSKTAAVTIAGNRVDVPTVEGEKGRALEFEEQNGKWVCRGPLDSTALTGKRPGLQGPIDDAFARPFLCVRGTGKAWNPTVAAWAEANLKRFADEWRRHYRGYLPVKNDIEVTEEDVKKSNLILFGDPGSNSWVGRVLQILPIQWTQDRLELGQERHSAADHGVQLVYPNPLPGADGRYVVLNSGHTYHDAELRFSYMVFPRLGDWAIIKVGENPADAPASQVNETVVNSGFFDEAWQATDR